VIIFIERDRQYIVPGGGTVLKTGDRLHVLADRSILQEVRSLLEKKSG
jgi:Trk K+ transport system NAD-binding subunit